MDLAEGVRTPVVWSMVPPVADQLTVLLKLPVPFTAATHVEVAPTVMIGGIAVTVTEVTVDGDEVAARPTTFMNIGIWAPKYKPPETWVGSKICHTSL
jgi:hypothetical protein